jgi:hypothetical protein
VDRGHFQLTKAMLAFPVHARHEHDRAAIQVLWFGVSDAGFQFRYYKLIRGANAEIFR